MIAGALVLVAMTRVGLAGETAETVESAVANASRPLADRQRDEDRKPADAIAFAGLAPGDRIAEFLPPTGYWTRIFCAVVGNSGRVYSVVLPDEPPPQSASVPATGAPADEPSSEPACRNVTRETLKSRNYPAPQLHSDSDDPGHAYEYWSPRLPVESYVAAEPLDMIWTSETYHALHTERFGAPSPRFVGTAWFKALKPGGTLIVEDYAASAGSGTRDAKTLHRIEPGQVRRELVSIGFEFVAESPALHRADDAHTGDAYAMGDEADRFLLEFRKPDEPGER